MLPFAERYRLFKTAQFPSVDDERIAKTSPTAANDLFPPNRAVDQVEAWLAMIRRKWDKENPNYLEGSPERNLAKDFSLGREPSSFLLDLSNSSISAIEG